MQPNIVSEGGLLESFTAKSRGIVTIFIRHLSFTKVVYKLPGFFKAPN